MKTLAGHTSRKSVASSTMIWSGLVMLLFILVHVKQFKYGAWYQTAGEHPVRDLARTEFEVFSQPLWVAFYVACTLLVGLHLRHGISSGLPVTGRRPSCLHAAADDVGRGLCGDHRRRPRVYSDLGLFDKMRLIFYFGEPACPYGSRQ